MSNEPQITAETNRHEQLIHVHRDGRDWLALTYPEARQLLGELAAEALETLAGDRPLGQALGDLLEALADGLQRRHQNDPLPDGVEGNAIGGRRVVCERCGALVRVVGGRLGNHARPAGGDFCRNSGKPTS